MASLKVTDLGDYLREQRQHARLSLRQLAEAAGVSNPYLSQVERGLRKPSAEVLQQIAKGLRISAEALYVRAGLLEERGDRIEVEAAILADPHLSERQRRVLLDIYETFRTENARDRAAGEAAAASAEQVTAQHGAGQSKPATRRPRKTASKTAGKAAARKSTAKKATTRSSAAKRGTATEGGN